MNWMMMNVLVLPASSPSLVAPHHTSFRPPIVTGRRPLSLFATSRWPPPILLPPPRASAADPDHDRPYERESGDGIEIEVSKAGRNRRLVEARVGVEADLDSVWAVLTDYEGLADFIPGLAVSRLLDRADAFARIYQVGQQDLALGLKFNARGVLECYEKDLELLPPSGRRREIEFRMVEGDFHTFQGAWSVLQHQNENKTLHDQLEKPHFETTLSYSVQLEPKLWLPVGLVEGRICREIRINLSSIRDEAQRIQSTR